MNIEKAAVMLLAKYGQAEFDRLLAYADKYAEAERRHLNRITPDTKPIKEGSSAHNLLRMIRRYKLLGVSYEGMILCHIEKVPLTFIYPESVEEIEELIMNEYGTPYIFDGEFQDDCHLNSGYSLDEIQGDINEEMFS